MNKDTQDDDLLDDFEDDEIDEEIVDEDEKEEEPEEPEDDSEGDDVTLEDDDPSDDDLKDIENQKIRNRIMREKRRADESVERLREKDEELKTFRAEAEQRESDLIKKERQAHLTSVTQGLKVIDIEREKLQREKTEAQSEGEFEKAEKADEKLRDLKVREARFTDLKAELESSVPEKTEDKAEDTKPPEKTTPNPHAIAFAQKNSWFKPDDPTDADTAMTLAMVRKLQNEGLNPKEEGFYTELAKRVFKKNNKLEVRTPDNKRVVGKRRRGRTGSPEGKASPGGKAQGLNLTRDDRTFFESMGLDLSDEQTLKILAEERARS